MLTSTFNSKSTELENKIKENDIIAVTKSAVTKANSIKSNLNDYAKKTDVANDISFESFESRLKQKEDIADEVQR